MGKLTKEQWDEVIIRYQAGEAMPPLAKEFGCSKVAIGNKLERLGIKRYSGPCVRLTQEQWDEIIARYQRGEFASDLAEEFNCALSTIGDGLKRKGIEKHSFSHVHRIASGCALNENSFDELTPDAAYWIGFLMADGCVGDNGRISLRLHLKDEGHIHKFREFLSSNHAVSLRNNNTASELAFRSRPLCEALGKYGVIPRKSHDAKVSEDLLYNTDFWRGAIDGDGSVLILHEQERRVTRPNGYTYHVNQRDTVKLSLVGSYNLMNQFHAFVLSIIPEFRGKVRPHKTIYEVSIKGYKAIPVIDTLYSNASTVLDRKAEVARQILEHS